MGHLSILTRAEIETLGPPTPEELAETGIPDAFLCDLALKHVAMLPEPTTAAVADRLHLPRALTEELLYHLYREKLIEMRLQSAVGSTRYAMLDHGWERLSRLQSQSGYLGPAPVSLDDYSHMMRLQAVPSRSASMDTVRAAFKDLILPDSLLQTLGCVINSRSSLFLTGLPGTGKTAVSERMNAALFGFIWIPYAIEIDGQIIRVFDSHCHRPVPEKNSAAEHDRRWVEIERPLVIVAGELTLDNTDLTWSESAKFYEAPFQVKSNGGTLVIDDFGRQRVAPQDLLNRWILPLERRVDFLTLHNGKKIEVPFEQLVVFSTNLEERNLVDEAFLRRMGYRARVEPPTPGAFVEIFKRVASIRGIAVDQECLNHVLGKYVTEKRVLKGCEPRDLLNKVADLCVFEGRALQLTPELIDLAWGNYFGTAHGFGPEVERFQAAEALPQPLPVQ
ncbi:MAG: ATP-binding protein [Acidobacteriota bacterium]|nr:ATP-binding protein [Acidobacteriota bacterium]